MRGTLCSGSIKPDTNLGGNIPPLNEVFHGKAAMHAFNNWVALSRAENLSNSLSAIS